MEVEPPAKLDLKGKIDVSFEKYLNVRVSGQGKVELELPISVMTNKITLEGEVTLEIESEAAPAFRIPKKPSGKVMKKILEALEPIENALSSPELASKLGLSERQVRMQLGLLVNRRLIGAIGEKGKRRYYKLGVPAKGPRETRSAEIPGMGGGRRG